MLHFDGLNQNAYGELHKEIHKAHWNSRANVLPKRINRTIFLAGKHNKENGRNLSAPVPSSSGTCAMTGVACIQAGKLEEHDKGVKALAMA